MKKKFSRAPESLSLLGTRNRRGFTLIETVLAVAIIAAVALPLLGIFLQSAKTDQAAESVLSANYITQDYMESLDNTLYELALSGRPQRTETNGYYLTSRIQPYGTAGSLFSGPCEYAHLVFYSDGRMLAVLPDGQWHMYSQIPATISLYTSGNVYSFSAGSTSLTGSMSVANCALLVNAMDKPPDTTFAVTLSSYCKAITYCHQYDADNITITGTGQTYCDLITGENSLVHVTANVYETADAADPVATSEGYIDIKN